MSREVEQPKMEQWMREAAREIAKQQQEYDRASFPLGEQVMAEIIAAHATTPATDSDWQWWFECTAEDRLRMIRQIRAGMRVETPAFRVSAPGSLIELAREILETIEVGPRGEVVGDISRIAAMIQGGAMRVKDSAE